MTKDQIDELMRENGIVVVGEAVYRLCNLVETESAIAEREACAKEISAEINDEIEDEAYCILVTLLARIQARGQE